MDGSVDDVTVSPAPDLMTRVSDDALIMESDDTMRVTSHLTRAYHRYTCEDSLDMIQCDQKTVRRVRRDDVRVVIIDESRRQKVRTSPGRSDVGCKTMEEGKGLML